MKVISIKMIDYETQLRFHVASSLSFNRYITACKMLAVEFKSFT